jgi:alkylhydroperoxidase family enzyme
MTWIRTVAPDEADPGLEDCYQAVYALFPPEYGGEVPAVRRADGSADSITAAHSLIPEALRHAMSAFGVLLASDLPLARRQHEMIATVVSALNRCFY